MTSWTFVRIYNVDACTINFRIMQNVSVPIKAIIKGYHLIQVRAYAFHRIHHLNAKYFQVSNCGVAFAYQL
jgi:hypothetical protein